MAIGGTDGVVQMFDWRVWDKPVVELLPCADTAVTATNFSGDGRYFGVGLSSGLCRIFDIRRADPLSERDHYCDSPIVTLEFADSIRADLAGSTAAVVSADSGSIKVWTFQGSDIDARSYDPFNMLSKDTTGKGDLLVSLETVPPVGLPPKTQLQATPGRINSVAVVPGSGLIFAAQDNPRLGVYFIPLLGPAPKWCRFLDALTAEEEDGFTEKEGPSEVYDGYAFVTKEQLEAVKASDLIKTKMLKPALHGFWIDALLWAKLQIAAGEIQAERLAAKKAAAAKDNEKMRIKLPRSARKVNDELAKKLEKEAESESKKVSFAAKEVLADDRFAELFTQPGFAIDITRVEQ